MSSATSWLERLRDLTVAPPATDVVAELLAAWAPIAAARAKIFAEPDHPTMLDPEHAPLVAELRAREDAWSWAFAMLRDRVVASRLAIAKARRYQHVARSADFVSR
jgi:hypothetical protein